MLKKPKIYNTYKDVHAKDVEANRFAMELLMPEEFIHLECEKLKNIEPMIWPEKLAPIFRMTPGVIGARLRDLKIGFYGTF